MAEQFLTVEQAATRLQVQPITVRRHLRSGLLRGIKRGNLWRVPESALTEPALNPQAVLPALLTKKPMTLKRQAAIQAVTGALKGHNAIWGEFEVERQADIERENQRDLI